ncbi:hypothetical protein [Mesobacillus sp. S13]|uniref:hypothetical protein n=1 Tax=Mesobacillus sp. S13 TaxID=2880221 RepID=UPI001CF1412E|nr:hypothetical protein [Mesobacillus sp. S13]
MKKTGKIAGVILGVGIVFAAGTFTGATTDWFSNAVNTANSTIGKAGFDKKTELIANSDADINVKIVQEIGVKIDAEEVELQALLDEYYQMRLDGLTESQRYQDLEAQIDAITNNVYERYKQEIDAVFDA